MYKQIIALFLIVFTFTVHAQTAATLKVEGEVQTPLTLTIKDLATFKNTPIKAKDRDGKEHSYTGVALHEVLQQAGVTLGGQLRGENLAKYIRIKATDGYEVVYSLAEVDPEFTDKVVVLAYEVDGKPLPIGEGPFRIVAPGDKKHARWIRQIASIKILFAKD
ncbi:molybdopterin-dependent oxidoreductase [Dawidia cretensis]|nr:molybdopterin-dependent oxidoreductase [Dawidia cretensis]